MSRALVLLHGWGLNRCVWEPLLARLPDSISAHALDLPGYGCASVEPYRIDTLAEAVLAQAPRNAIWLGSSLGGMVALQVAVAHPQRVARLLLVGTTPRFVNDDDWRHGTDARVFANFDAELAADYRKALQRFLFLQTGQARNARETVRALSARINERGIPERAVLRAGLECLRTADLRPRLREARCPVHVIQGALDRITPPSAADYLTDQLPAAALSRLRCGHLPFVSHPDDFAALIQADLCA